MTGPLTFVSPAQSGSSFPLLISSCFTCSCLAPQLLEVHNHLHVLMPLCSNIRVVSASHLGPARYSRFSPLGPSKEVGSVLSYSLIWQKPEIKVAIGNVCICKHWGHLGVLVTFQGTSEVKTIFIAPLRQTCFPFLLSFFDKGAEEFSRSYVVIFNSLHAEANMRIQVF